jgi:hypothetical protein
MGGMIAQVIAQNEPALVRNGYYFHNDRAKAAKLRRLSGLDGGLVRHAALDLVVEGSRHVQFLGWAIVFGRREGVLSI